MTRKWKRRWSQALMQLNGAALLAIIVTDKSLPVDDFLYHLFWGIIFFPLLVWTMDGYRDLMKEPTSMETP